MNKYEELKKKTKKEIQLIKQHELKLNELKEEIDKTEQEEKCSNKMPFEIGDECYYISISGDTFSDTWDDDEIDMWKLNQENAFKTEEEAEDKLFQLRLEGKAREYRRINNCDVSEEDWKNMNKNKYYIYYSLINGIAIDSHCINIEPTKLGYFNSEEMVKKFVKENKEDLLKYFDIEMKLSK